MATADLTAARLRELLHYDPETGIFTRLVSAGSSKVGSRLGANSRQPYLKCSLMGRFHLLHRLAWLYSHGEWPAGEIDHINGDGRDNRLSNLRDASHSLNQQNQRGPQSNGTTGALGVHRHRNRFRACISADGVRHTLGLFSSVEAAKAAYDAAKKKLHPLV